MTAIASMFKAARLAKNADDVRKKAAETEVNYLDPTVFQGATNEKGVPHGQGRYQFASGDVYEGMWQDG